MMHKYSTEHRARLTGIRDKLKKVELEVATLPCRAKEDLSKCIVGVGVEVDDPVQDGSSDGEEGPVDPKRYGEGGVIAMSEDVAEDVGMCDGLTARGGLEPRLQCDVSDAVRIRVHIPRGEER